MYDLNKTQVSINDFEQQQYCKTFFVLKYKVSFKYYNHNNVISM